jgi:hypothetical protein
MQPPKRIAGQPVNWHPKGLARVLLIVTAVAIVVIASMFGIARDYAHLRASLLTGTPSITRWARALRPVPVAGTAASQ